jgi:hypothetical protein
MGPRGVESGEWREKREGTTKDTKYTKKWSAAVLLPLLFFHLSLPPNSPARIGLFIPFRVFRVFRGSPLSVPSVTPW